MRRIEVRGMPTGPHTTAAAIDGAGWGLFFIWVGTCLLADLGWTVFFLGTGALMVGGQLSRRYFELGIDRFALFLGSCFALASLARMFELRWQWGPVPPWAAPAVFIAIGVALVVLALRRSR